MNKNIVKFCLQNFLRIGLLLLAVSILSFCLITASPIDPIDAYIGTLSVTEEQHQNIAAFWGLDKPPLERLTCWLKKVIQGDFGMSLIYRQPVLEVIIDKFKTSLALMGTAWVLAGLLGFSLGILAGAKKGSKLDKFIKVTCLLLASTPVFWLGLVLLIIFAVELQLFPIGLANPIGQTAVDTSWIDKLHHMILPALTLSIGGIANIALHTRQKLIDVLNSEYVLFARARGESQIEIIKRHGLRNILMPAITLQFAYFNELFGGSILAEKVFSYPGLGETVTLAGLKGDMPLLLGIAVFSSVFVFSGNLIANILYGFIDPQIKEGGQYE